MSLTLASVPAIPPGAPSGAYPPYSPAGQQAAATWAVTLQTRPPVYGTPEDIGYQIRTAGQPERYIPTATGGGVWADGYRDSDGALIDAKHVRNQGCSPRTLQGLQEENRATGFLVGKDDDEISRYGDAIINPANKCSTSKSTPTTSRPSVTGSTSPRRTTCPATYGMCRDLAQEAHARR